MNNDDRKIQLSRNAEIFIGIFFAFVSISLIVLCITIITKGDWSSQIHMKKGITILSYPASFAVFFSIIAINLLKSNKEQLNASLMSLIGWKLLAGIMFGFGLIIFIYGNWIGALLPFMIGAISLSKDPKIREIYYETLVA